jgi:hypothetical protein
MYVQGLAALLTREIWILDVFLYILWNRAFVLTLMTIAI